MIAALSEPSKQPTLNCDRIEKWNLQYDMTH
ncbi:MAG: hypothetical protein ACI9ZT_000466, partial [Gammaproteobacteria bacterium]